MSGSSSTEPFCLGRTAVCAGVTSGFGIVYMKKLVELGILKLIVLTDDAVKGNELAGELENEGVASFSELKIVHCDFASMYSVKQAAHELKGEPIHILVLNASIFTTEKEETIDGLEKMYAVNFLSQFYLVRNLEKNLVKNAPGRIVFTVSDAPRFVLGWNLDDKGARMANIGTVGQEEEEEDEDGWPLQTKQYARTRLMGAMLCTELARIHEESNLLINAFYPGIADTDLIQTENNIFQRASKLAQQMIARQPEEAVRLGVYICSTPNLQVTGKLFHSGQTGEVTDFEPKEFTGSPKNETECFLLWSQAGKIIDALTERWRDRRTGVSFSDFV